MTYLQQQYVAHLPNPIGYIWHIDIPQILLPLDTKNLPTFGMLDVIFVIKIKL
jgi:hypothetical protein